MKKLRRSMMFFPACNPKMLFTAQIYNPDCIIFDLEDAVAYAEKDSARDLLCEALKAVDYGNIEVSARINGLYTEFGETDVRELVKAGLKYIRLPMCESSEDVQRLVKLLEEVEKENGIEIGTVKLQCAIETPKGIENAYEIAKASDRIVTISFGAEDFTKSLGTDRTKAARELFYARTRVVIAASAAGVDSIDMVWADMSYMEEFIAEAKDAKKIGFSGKSCVHPSQVKEMYKIFTPTREEVTGSTGVIMRAQGGHPDTAAGAKLTVVVAPLMRKRIPIVVNEVTTVVTSGETVDVVVTERGVAVNPRRTDIIDKLSNTNVPIMTIEELKNLAEKFTGIPEKPEFDEEIVGIVEYRDGTIMDVIRKLK